MHLALPLDFFLRDILQVVIVTLYIGHRLLFDFFLASALLLVFFITSFVRDLPLSLSIFQLL